MKFVAPMMPKLVDTAPAGEGWLHEVKFDGYRTQVHLEGGKVFVFTRNGTDWTERYAPIAYAAAQLPCSSTILDGEVYLPDSRGAADFHGLRSAITRRPQELVFVAFDLLHLGGVDTRRLPLEERRGRLQGLIAGSGLSFSEALDADGPAAFAAVDGLGLEGIVSKRAGSRYKSGDSDAWVKTKAFIVETLEVIGVDRTDKRGMPVALLARETPDGLLYAGDAIVSLSAPEREAFWSFVEEHAVALPRIKGMRRKGTWLPPGLAATIKHLRGEDVLRHASLTGLVVKPM